MDHQNKTKDELITELQKLQEEFDSFKVAHLNEIHEAHLASLQGEILKNISEGINLVRIEDETIVFANPKFEKMFGYERGELIGKDVSVLNAQTKKSPDEIKEEIIDIINRTGEWHGQILNRKKNGEVFWCSVNVSIFDHPDYGKVFLSVHSDITERIRAADALRDSEAKFRSIFENSLSGISITSPDGRLLQINLAYARMYGYDNPKKMLDEVPNVGILYAHSKEREEVIRVLRQKGQVEAREIEVTRRDGSHFFVLVSAAEVRDPEGHLIYNQTIHLDLTERKKAEEKIHETLKYARNLLESSIDPLVTINSEGKISDVNLATEQITGFNREKLIGSDFADYFTAPDKARKGYETVFSKGVVKDYPLTILNKSGKKTKVLYNATLFKNAAGKVQGVFAAARDITNLNKMETELRTSKKLLEKLNSHQDKIRENERAQIAINLHDDLGQRLTALNLDMSWIKSRIGVQSEIVREKLNEINLAINETIESVKEISGSLRPAILYDLGLVSAIKHNLDIFEKQTGINCTFQSNAGESKIDDRISLALYRVFQESFTNIARHSEATSAEVILTFHKKQTEMIIRDNGIGINNRAINSLRSMGITGMKERMRMIDGNIRIKGGKNIGTTLLIRIPTNKKNNYD